MGYNQSMSHVVATLLEELGRLSPDERSEFFSLVTVPAESRSDDWTDDDFSAVAAQTFARLDVEEAAAASAHSKAR